MYVSIMKDIYMIKQGPKKSPRRWNKEVISKSTQFASGMTDILRYISSENVVDADNILRLVDFLVFL